MPLDLNKTLTLAAGATLCVGLVGCNAAPSSTAGASSAWSPSSPAELRTFAPSVDAIQSVDSRQADAAQVALSETERAVDFSPYPNAADPAFVSLPSNVVGAVYGLFEAHSPESFEAAAAAASRAALSRPATSSEALVTPHADLDGDGFVTVDELAALSRTWSDASIVIDRVDATAARFFVDPALSSELLASGVDASAVALINARSFPAAAATGVASVPTTP
ncbi:MAG: hypothetical protein AAF823_15320 [Planctomycetota bacterium]